jgi:FkbM family methyltransferase
MLPNAQVRPGSLLGLLSRTGSFRGKARVVDALAGARLAWSRDSVEFPLYPDVPFSVDLRDRIQRQMWAGCYETHVTRRLAAALRPGDVFIDVGAHIGYHSATAAHFVGPSGRVFSFEPNPRLFPKLEHNLASLPHASCFQKAVWAESAHVSFCVSPGLSESGWSSLATVRQPEGWEQVTVETVTLDTWSDLAGLTAVRAIKIDAEGSELGILRGAGQMLQRFRPLLFMELNDPVLRQAGSSSQEVREVLTSLHYRVYPITEGRPALAAAEDSGDFLCLPAEQADQTHRG